MVQQVSVGLDMYLRCGWPEGNSYDTSE